jgi:hypothetical protein
MKEQSDHPPYTPHPGGSPFPPGEEPTLKGTIKLFVAAGGEIEWTHVAITPAGPMVKQPIRIHCEGCDFSIIAPDENLQIHFLPEQQATNDPGYIVKLDGTATLVIYLHQLKGSTEFFWPYVTVTYYQNKKLIGETRWGPPEEE